MAAAHEKRGPRRAPCGGASRFYWLPFLRGQQPTSHLGRSRDGCATGGSAAILWTHQRRLHCYRGSRLHRLLGSGHASATAATAVKRKRDGPVGPPPRELLARAVAAARPGSAHAKGGWDAPNPPHKKPQHMQASH